MQTVILAFHGIGILVTVLNLLTFLGLRRRILVAFPKRGRLAAWLVAVPFWLLLFPSWSLARLSGLVSPLPTAPPLARSTVLRLANTVICWFYKSSR